MQRVKPLPLCMQTDLQSWRVEDGTVEDGACDKPHGCQCIQESRCVWHWWLRECEVRSARSVSGVLRLAGARAEGRGTGSVCCGVCV